MTDNTNTPGTFAFPISQAADDDVERLLSLPGAEVIPVALSLPAASALRQGDLDVVDILKGTHATDDDARDLARSAGFPDRIAYLRLDIEQLPALQELMATKVASQVRWWGEEEDVALAAAVTVGNPLLLELAPEPGEGDPVAWPSVPGRWEHDEERQELVLGARRPHTLVLPRFGIGQHSWARMVVEALDGDDVSLTQALRPEAELAGMVRQPVHTGNVVANPLRQLDALRHWWDSVVESLDHWHLAHDDLLGELERQLPAGDALITDLRRAGRYSDAPERQYVRVATSQHTIDSDQRRVWARAHTALWALEHGSDDVVTGVKAGLLSSMEDRIAAERLAAEAPGWAVRDDVVTLVGKLDEGALLHPDADDLTLIRLADSVAEGLLESSTPTWVTAKDVSFKGAAVSGFTRTDRLDRQVVFGPELLTAAITGSVRGRTGDAEAATEALEQAAMRLQAARSNLEAAETLREEVATERRMLLERVEADAARRDALRDELAELEGAVSDTIDSSAPDDEVRMVRTHLADLEADLDMIQARREATAERLDAAERRVERAREILVSARAERNEAAHAVASLRERGAPVDPKADAARLRAMGALVSLSQHLRRTDHRWAERVAELVDSAAAVVPTSRVAGRGGVEVSS